MTDPAPQTPFILKVAGGFAMVAALVGVLVSCTGGDDAAPTSTTTDQAVSMSTGDGQEISAPTADVQATSALPVDVPALPTPGPGDVGAVGGKVGAAEGFIADGEWVSVFDTDLPAVGNLQPDLLAAVQQAQADAARDGVDLFITSGWRSERYQQGLLDSAIVTYGSVAEARKWVSTPEESSHVTGNAVDIGPTDAAYWVNQYGNQYGLCQTYSNEIWHYELVIEPGGTCPAPISDASSAEVVDGNQQHSQRSPSQGHNVQQP